MDFASIDELIRLGKVDRAAFYLHQYEALYPQDVELALHLAEVYNRLNVMPEAERYYHKVLALDPQNVMALASLEGIVREQGRNAECRVLLSKIVKLAPDLAQVVASSKAMMDLAEGNLFDGFQGYENRFAFQHMRKAYEMEFFPRWKGGESLARKRVLLRYEQGLGDTIQFVRFADALKQRGASHVTVLCKECLHRMVLTVPGVDDVLPHDATPTTGFDVEVMMMSMPAILQIARDCEIPKTPYMFVKPADLQAWREKMEPLGKLNVGLVWSGELKKGLNSWQAERMNLRRSIPLEQWRSILEADCNFFSLQKGEMEQSLVDFPSVHPIQNIMPEVKDFYDTACIVRNLDLVIAVDTAMAHLSGALGVPTWVFHRLDGDWRWLLDRSDSPWYRSVEVFRQKTFENWWPTIYEVAQRLHEKRGAC